MGHRQRRIEAERLAERSSSFRILELLEQGDAKVVRAVGVLARCRGRRRRLAARHET